jgi:hypothetical protein
VDGAPPPPSQTLDNHRQMAVAADNRQMAVVGARTMEQQRQLGTREGAVMAAAIPQ